MKYCFLVLAVLMFNLLSAQTVDTMVIKRVDSLITYSRSLIFKGKYDDALESLKIMEGETKVFFGDTSVQFGYLNYNRGIAYYYKQNLAEAQKYYLVAIQIFERKSKKTSLYASCLMNLATVLVDQRKYEEAEPYYTRSAEIFSLTLGKDHPNYAAAISGIGYLYLGMANFKKSESFYLEASAIQEKTKGKKDPNYAQTLNNLGYLYSSMGDYKKAEKIYKKALAIREEYQGKVHPDYAESLNNLGVLYYEKIGDFQKAEPYYLEAMEISKKVLGNEDPGYADNLTNLGILYEAMGNFEKAETYYLDANNIREKALGKNSVDYAKSLSNLAGFYTTIGKKDKVEHLLMVAKNIYETTESNDTTAYANSLTNLAGFYASIGTYDKAEELFLKVKSIHEEASGKNHPETAKSLNNLANLYELIGVYDKAIKLDLEAKTILENTFGRHHPEYTNILKSSFRVLELQKNYVESEKLLKEYNELTIQRLTQSASFLSEKELALYYKTFKEDVSIMLFFLLKRYLNLEETGVLPDLCYDQILFQKGFLLKSVNRLKDLVNSSPQTSDLNSQLNGYRMRIADELTQPIKDQKNLLELEEKANKLEKELAKVTSEYSNIIRQYKWQDVQSKLKKDEAAIEFVDFTLSIPGQEDSVMYAAILVKSSIEKPLFIPLFKEEQLLQILNSKSENQKSEFLAQLYSRGVSPSKNQNLYGLYELVWKPLEKPLQGIQTIYYAPAGLLHRINFDAMVNTRGITLGNQFKLSRMGSTRTLMERTRKLPENINEVILFGGIKYDLDTSRIEIDSIESREYSLTLAIRGEANQGNNWNYLPGTESEIKEISKQISNSGFTVKKYIGEEASENEFKKIGNGERGPRVLHIATHGFFFSDPHIDSNRINLIESDPAFKISDNPMIRSGLILAGGNYAWKEGKPFKDGMEDGILTAYEISQMNLSNTELVVLSACETGLGDIQGNEGVYGLQRAFKIAGAKYLMMSLWQVPDEETKEFMITFYKNWLNAKGPAQGGKKLSIPDAFRLTQKEMRDKYTDPYLWAGFVLVE